jgi:dTDP-4-amino-4,6-dideoxygalactose transaminase
VLIEKLPFLDQWVEERRQVAGSYRRRLRGMGLDVIGDVSSVWHQCVVRVPNREVVRAAMERRGVGTGVHYERALSEMAWLEPYRADVVQGMSCVEAERAAREVLSLPIWPSMPISIIDRVVNVLGESIEQAKREAE